MNDPLHKRFSDTHRESINAVLGAPPELVPLDEEVLKIERLAGYRRETVRYHVGTGDYPVSYVLIPDGLKHPTAAVICHHRHDNQWHLGKDETVGLAGDPENALAVELVRQGFVVIAPDALGFGSRRPYEDAGYENMVHELNVRLLRGETLLKKAIWDISRAIDILETRPEVDIDRIGMIGQGMGAMMTMFSMVVDLRIVAGVGHGQWRSMHEMISQRLHFQTPLVVPRLLQVADYDRILSLVVPRSFLMTMLENDPTSPNAEQIYERAAAVYSQFEADERLQMQQFAAEGDGLGYSQAAREAGYAWLRQWLMPHE